MVPSLIFPGILPQLYNPMQALPPDSSWLRDKLIFLILDGLSIEALRGRSWGVIAYHLIDFLFYFHRRGVIMKACCNYQNTTPRISLLKYPHGLLLIH